MYLRIIRWYPDFDPATLCQVEVPQHEWDTDSEEVLERIESAYEAFVDKHPLLADSDFPAFLLRKYPTWKRIPDLFTDVIVGD